MQTVLLVIYLMVVVALIGVVLIQRSEGGGLGIGGGSGFMSARGTANALTRTTAILAALFFVLALAMGILARYQPQATDILDRIPGTSSGGGVLDSLGGGNTTAPAGGATQQPATGNGATAPAPATTGEAPAGGATTTQTPAGGANSNTQTPAGGANSNTGSQVPSGQ
ncbi:preprotein translocase subunit SecG [Ensifer sp. 4252]|uniref:preprotein translocase subunit SecG n=1 Tax=Ensifer sp. 4252 TaxID=3373915 RepID=UPI003D25514E